MRSAYRRILELLEAPPSPLQQVDWPAATAAGVELYVKRDELLDPRISGNKWRKLLPQLAWHLRQGKTSFATVGGVHSNHIPAFAALLGRVDNGSLSHIQNIESGATVSEDRMSSSHIQNIRLGHTSTQISSSFAFVRGNLPNPLSQSLAFAKTCGLELKAATREQVRNWRNSSPTPEELQGATWIPEGGTNKLGLLGMASCYREIEQQLGQVPDAIIAAVIYTAKALLKLDQLLWRGEFDAGSKIVLLHTGGLQGLEPWMKRYWPETS